MPQKPWGTTSASVGSLSGRPVAPQFRKRRPQEARIGGPVVFVQFVGERDKALLLGGVDHGVPLGEDPLE